MSNATTFRTGAAGFPRTHWSVVLSAQGKDAPQSGAALESLCRTYWNPLYAYVRRSGHSPHDAQDLTQEFFARLLARGYLERADRAKGRFRTFLLTALKRFMIREWERARAQKRGGGHLPVPLDTELAEQLYAAGPATKDSPERLYDRQCALALLDAALRDLQGEFAQAGNDAEFASLKPYLTAERGEIPYAELAVRLNRDAGAARVAVHRFRKRYRQLFREQVAQTVLRPEDAEDEVSHLMEALSG